MATRLRIWAPRAHSVEVLVGDSRITARHDGEGTWVGPELHHGQRYAVSLDGGRALPDPRSRYQPDGVEGMSCWIDLERPAHTFRQVPLHSALIYELHVGTFTADGTFEAIAARLDALVDLGVTHVELMPIAAFSGVHGWGYDGVDLYAPHAPYGGPRGLRDLISQCHARGLAVLIDVVHNHFGPEGAPWGTYAPYMTPKHKTPWGDAINLDDTGSREVRRFLIDSALGWLRDYGADGLRLDAVHALVDTSERHFITELVDEVRALERELGRPLVLVGEYDEHDPRAVTERERGGWGLDAHWNDDFHHVVHALLTGEHGGYYGDFTGSGALRKVLEAGYVLDGGYSPFRKANHGTPFGELPRDRLVGYIQSHDQIGNRALGERLHHLAGIERAQIAAALLMVSPFVPMIFQGEEWAASTPFLFFADLQSEELREAVRKGRAAEHAGAGWREPPPDPIEGSTRDRSVLRWDERDEPEHAGMLAWYRALVEARRTHAGLRDTRAGSTRVHRDGELVVVERGDVSLVCNLGASPAGADLRDVLLASRGLSSASELPPVSCALTRGSQEPRRRER
jgi:maltooligosyltrehalose trehalohydrolase